MKIDCDTWQLKLIPIFGNPPNVNNREILSFHKYPKQFIVGVTSLIHYTYVPWEGTILMCGTKANAAPPTSCSEIHICQLQKSTQQDEVRWTWSPHSCALKVSGRRVKIEN